MVKRRIPNRRGQILSETVDMSPKDIGTRHSSALGPVTSRRRTKTREESPTSVSRGSAYSN